MQNRNDATAVAHVPPSPLIYTAIALMCTLLWAGAQVGVKVGLHSAPPLTLMAIRFLIAGLLLQAVCAWAGSPWPASWAGMGRLVVLGLLNNTVYLGLTALGLARISAGLNCVLTGINPLALALGGWLAFDERINKKDLLGLMGALGGVAWVMAGRLGHDNHWSGVMLTTGANCVMVAGNLLYKRWQHEAGLLHSHSVQLLVGGVTLGVAAALTESRHALVLDATFFGAELFLIFGVSFGAMISWLYLLSRGTAARAGAYLFLVPLFGLGLSAVLMHERISLRDIYGTLLTTACIYLVQRPKGEAVAVAMTADATN